MRRYKTVHYATESPSYEQMLEELAGIFRSVNVEEREIAKIVADLQHSRTNHATKDSLERGYYEKLLKNNPEMVKKLIRLFYYDYILFGFPIPDIN